MKIENSQLSFLLGLANDLRIAKGDDPLDDLPQGDVGNPYSCIIANAFNYGCEVSPAGDPEMSSILFKSPDDLDLYLKLVPDAKEISRYDRNSEYSATLSEPLNEIACDFDNYVYPDYIADDEDEDDYPY